MADFTYEVTKEVEEETFKAYAEQCDNENLSPGEFTKKYFKDIFDVDIETVKNSEELIAEFVRYLRPYKDPVWKNYVKIKDIPYGVYFSRLPGETDPKYIYLMQTPNDKREKKLVVMTNIGSPLFVKNFTQRCYIVPEETIDELKAKRKGTAW